MPHPIWHQPASCCIEILSHNVDPILVSLESPFNTGQEGNWTVSNYSEHVIIYARQILVCMDIMSPLPR